MRTLLSLIAGLLLSLPALAQVSSDGVTGGPSFYVTTPTNGQCFVFQSATGLWINGSCGGAGSVSSVALADGSIAPIFTISGSPVTGTGTLTETLATESANSIFAGPTSGGVAQPTFRSLTAADLPAGVPTAAANPTGTVGLTAVNGSAATYPRSDSAPALSQTINPTWTAQHNWAFTGQTANTDVYPGTTSNTTTAASTLEQFMCYPILTAQGWKTNATAASIPLDWEICNEPQDNATGFTNLFIRSRVNGGAWVAQFEIQSNGNAAVTGTLSASTGSFSGSVQATSVTATTRITSGGTKFTASGCSNSTTVGGAVAGSFTSGTTGACTVVITLPGATNGYTCSASDLTTPANLIAQSASSTTSCTITGTTVSGDSIHFMAIAY